MAIPQRAGTREACNRGTGAGWITPDGTWSVRLGEPALDALFQALHNDEREIIGPTVRNGAVVLAPITAVDDLPAGWHDTQDAGHYRATRAGHRARFTHAVPAQGWKRFVHPPEERLWRAHRPVAGGLILEDDAPPQKRRAFLGVRSCDLAALAVLDRVLAGPDQPDPAYAQRRRDTLVISVDCGTPAASCFCASMDTGPAARDGFDLALVELVTDDDGAPVYLARPGSPAGAALLERLPGCPASEADQAAATDQLDHAVTVQTRALPPDIRGVLAGATDSRHWDDVAARCLACGNCTLSCPTCFCATVEDTTSLDGHTAERWRRWSSCFTEAFSYIHGGAVRGGRGTRYRQWITHKLSAWHDQFGGSGCVGCGRCITWCPVGIDITAEAAALGAEAHARPVASARGASTPPPHA